MRSHRGASGAIDAIKPPSKPTKRSLLSGFTPFHTTLRAIPTKSRFQFPKSRAKTSTHQPFCSTDCVRSSIDGALTSVWVEQKGQTPQLSAPSIELCARLAEQEPSEFQVRAQKTEPRPLSTQEKRRSFQLHTCIGRARTSTGCSPSSD